jgi:rhodanese-related sulfurtransferase/DNA-binding transcriptional ArsR family regulator
MQSEGELSELAARASALGHAHRLRLTEALLDGAVSVEDLAQRTGLSVPNASRHLQVLRRASLIVPERRGKNVYYRLADVAEYEALIAALRAVRDREAQVLKQLRRDYLRSRELLEPISRKDLLSGLRDGTVTLIDVRPNEEFAAGHIPGALSVPFESAEKHLARLPTSQEIVAYCRGPNCVLAFEVVAALQARGYRVRRLDDGPAEWRGAGLPLTTSS